MKLEEMNQFDYIATQPRVAGLDEIQQLFLAYVNGCHVALSGPPGVGKTTIIEEFAEKVSHPLISRVMGPKVNESMLISYPELINENGTSVTVTKPGILARALQTNSIYFADEFDRLSEDNQKLHNSAFDSRKSVTMRDGKLVIGGDNFLGVIAYNPTVGLKNDLETALADRFIHINFDYFPHEIEAKVTLKRTGTSDKSLMDDKMEWRAIGLQNNGQNKKMAQFFEVHTLKDNTVILKEPYKGKELSLSKANSSQLNKSLFVYQRIKAQTGTEGYVTPIQYSKVELAVKLAEFCKDIRNLRICHKINITF
jgi:hypothetical protein